MAGVPSRGPVAATRRRAAKCCFYPLRKGCLTIFIFLLNLEISDNAGRLGSGCQRPMWKSLSWRGGAREGGLGGAGGGESGQGCASCQRRAGNPGHSARRKLFAITDFLPALGPRTAAAGRGGWTRFPPPVRRGSSGAGWPRGWGARAVLASVPPAGGRKRRCSLARLDVARDSHYFEKLHLAWEKTGVSGAVGLLPGWLCAQGELPGCWWGWDPRGARGCRAGCTWHLSLGFSSPGSQCGSSITAGLHRPWPLPAPHGP